VINLMGALQVYIIKNDEAHFARECRDLIDNEL